MRGRTEIFSGVTYECDCCGRAQKGRGSPIGCESTSPPASSFYVTPLDPAAVRQEFEISPALDGDVVENERLAVAINGTLFTSTANWRLRLTGRPRQYGRDGGVRSRDRTLRCARPLSRPK